MSIDTVSRLETLPMMTEVTVPLESWNPGILESWNPVLEVFAAFLLLRIPVLCRHVSPFPAVSDSRPLTYIRLPAKSIPSIRIHDDPIHSNPLRSHPFQSRSIPSLSHRNFPENSPCPNPPYSQSSDPPHSQSLNSPNSFIFVFFCPVNGWIYPLSISWIYPFYVILYNYMYSRTCVF